MMFTVITSSIPRFTLAQDMLAFPGATVSQGWICPICKTVNSPNSRICINSYPMPYGTSVEWKHY